MNTVTCCDCGVNFGITEDMYRKRKEDGELFSCPNGHEQHYSPSENDKLKAEVKRLSDRADNYQNQSSAWHTKCCVLERSLSATKGVVTKLQKKLYPERFKVKK